MKLVTIRTISVSILSCATAIMETTKMMRAETTFPKEGAKSMPELRADCVTISPANCPSDVPRITSRSAAIMFGKYEKNAPIALEIAIRPRVSAAVLARTKRIRKYQTRNEQVQLLAQPNPLKRFIDPGLFHQPVEADPGQHVSQNNFD